jgi:ribose transport system permease protein
MTAEPPTLERSLEQDTPPTARPAESAPTSGTKQLRTIVDFGLKYATVALLVALLVVTTALNEHFWEVNNLRNILVQNAPIGLVAIGMTYVIIGGNFDLSVGSIFALSTLIVARLAGGVPIWVAIVATCLFGAAFGTVNGVVVTKFRVNSFIATFGTGAVISGLAFVYSSSKPIFTTAKGFDTIGLGRVFGFPWAGVVLLIAFLALGFVLSRTIYGRWIYAVGGNANSARLVGIRVDATRVSTFAVVGMLTALAGVLLASQLQVGEPTIGADTALDAFAIVVIGGTSVYGGEGALWRTAVGLTIISVLANLFNTLSLSNADQSIAKGLVLILALGLNALSRSRSRS